MPATNFVGRCLVTEPERVTNVDFRKVWRDFQQNVKHVALGLLIYMKHAHEARMKRLPNQEREIMLSVCDAIEEME